MMIRSQKALHSVLGVVAATGLVAGCSEKKPVDVRISAKYDPIFFGNDIRISLENEADVAICFLKSDLDPTLPNVLAYQGNRTLLPTRQSNREIISLSGVNVAGGIEVVPTGSRNFFVNLSQFPLKPGPFHIAVRINVVRCADLFSGKILKWTALHAKVEGKIAEV